MNFEIDGLRKARTQANREMTVYELSDGTPLPISHPPHDGLTTTQPAQHVASIVKKAANALAALDGYRATLAANVNLTERGKAEQMRPVLEAASMSGQGAIRELGEQEINVRAFEAKVFSPPALEPGDIVGALLDQEIRTHARSLKGDAVLKYALDLPNTPRHLEALLRSPVPMASELNVATKNFWSEHVKATNPRYAELQQHKAALEWGHQTLQAVTDLLTQTRKESARG